MHRAIWTPTAERTANGGLRRISYLLIGQLTTSAVMPVAIDFNNGRYFAGKIHQAKNEYHKILESIDITGIGRCVDRAVRESRNSLRKKT